MNHTDTDANADSGSSGGWTEALNGYAKRSTASMQSAAGQRPIGCAPAFVTNGSGATAASGATGADGMWFPRKYLMLTAANSVLREHASGRSVDPHRLQWANFIIKHNGEPPEDKQ